MNLRHSSDRDAYLRARAAELEVILASMADALLILDHEGRIVAHQPGRPRAALPGREQRRPRPAARQRPLGQLAGRGARDRGGAAPGRRGAPRRGEALREVEVEVELPGRGRRVISYSCAPLRDQVDSLGGGVIVFRDVTERRELERLKDDVFSTASHDLRAPLAAVRLRAEMLQRRLRREQIDAAGVIDGLDEIRRQVDRTVDQLRLLLDVARLQAGRLPLEREPVDLVAVVDAAVEEVGATTERHQLTLRAPDRVVGSWDEWRLREVLQNLLTNAVKYSPDGGAIETTIEADERWRDRARAGPRRRPAGRGAAERLRALLPRAGRAAARGERPGPVHLPDDRRRPRGAHLGRVGRARPGQHVLLHRPALGRRGGGGCRPAGLSGGLWW